MHGLLFWRHTEGGLCLCQRSPAPPNSSSGCTGGQTLGVIISAKHLHVRAACPCRLEAPVSALAVFDEMRQRDNWPAGVLHSASNIVLDSLSGDVQAAFAR